MPINYVRCFNRTGLLSLAAITSELINTGLLIFLPTTMGLKGVAVAFTILMEFKFLLTRVVAQLRHSVPWFDLSPIHLFPNLSYHYHAN